MSDDPRPELGTKFAAFLRELFGNDDEWKALVTPFRSFPCQNPKCRKPNQVRVLDVNALDKLFTQFYGKPPDPPQQLNVHVTTMSLGEKVAYLEELRARKAALALPAGDDAA